MRKIDEIKNKMVSFTCHKTVKAVQMSRIECAELMKYPKPEEDEPGYMIMHEPDEHPKLKDFEGQVSWSPKDVFEKGYRLSETFTDRLKIEMEDLEEKCEKLEDFLSSSKSESLDQMQRNLLGVQLSAMVAYYGTVRTRFELLTQSEEN